MRMIATVFFSLSGFLAAGLSLMGFAGAGEISSVYTSLELEKSCALVKTLPNEGGGALWDCKGYNGVRVRVAEGDLRFFVSFGENAGKQTAAGQTLAPFNNIHKTLEWRVERVGNHAASRFMDGANKLKAHSASGPHYGQLHFTHRIALRKFLLASPVALPTLIPIRYG